MIRVLPWKENTGKSMVCEEQNMGTLGRKRGDQLRAHGPITFDRKLKTLNIQVSNSY